VHPCSQLLRRQRKKNLEFEASRATQVTQQESVSNKKGKKKVTREIFGKALQTHCLGMPVCIQTPGKCGEW
jgi:hypothetical protein